MPYIHKSGNQFGLADISITTGVQCREVTQAQYDALSAAEKNNGTVYFITDGTPDNLYISDTIPIGAIQAYGGTEAPNGWLMCDGSAVNRIVYRDLFAVIGTTYGEGDTVTTFNLPNLKGRVAIGADTGYALGAIGGEATHTLDIAETPSHRHWISAGTYDDGNMSTTGVSNSQDNGLAADAGAYSASDTCKAYGRYDAWAGGSNGADGKGATQGTTSAHNNMQPYVVTNYIIKAKDTYQVGTSGQLQAMTDFFYPVGSYYETSDNTFDPNVSFGGTWVLETEGQVHVSAGENYTIRSTGGEATHTLTTTEMPVHSHGVTGGGVAAQTADGNRDWLVAGDSGTSYPHNMPFTINNAGGGQAHNNMQPYIVVNRWHRTA